MDTYHISAADSQGFHGFFKQDAACQTELSEMIDLKEVITLFLGLRESDYSIKLAEKVRQVVTSFNERIFYLEDMHQRQINTVRYACRTQLADAVIKMAREHKKYHEAVSSQLIAQHTAEITALREEVQKLKKDTFKKDDMIARLKSTNQKQLTMLKKLNAPDIEDNPTHELTMDKLRSELKQKDELIRNLRSTIADLEEREEQHSFAATHHLHHQDGHSGSAEGGGDGSGKIDVSEVENRAKEVERVYLMRIKEITEMNKKEMARARKEREREVREWIMKYEAAVESIRSFKDDQKMSRILQRQNALLQYATVFFPKRAKDQINIDPIGKPPGEESVPPSQMASRRESLASHIGDGDSFRFGEHANVDDLSNKLTSLRGSTEFQLPKIGGGQ